MRRVLVVTYFFPPLGGGGIQRTLKYVRHLPGVGWEPVVITARNPGYEIRDPALLADVPPGLEIHRSFVWEPSRAYRWLVSVSGYAGRRAEHEARRPITMPAGGSSGPTRGGRGIWADLSRYLVFPDDQIAWLPFAIRSAERAHRDEPATALYSSSPPVTAHLIAGIVKHRTGLPWVADFRDPWIGNAFALPLPRPHRRARRRIERWIVSTADRSVFATPSLTAMYQRRYPELGHRFVTVPNGYDRADYPTRVPPVQDGTFKLVYAGSLYGDRELAIFVGGLRQLLSRRPGLRERLLVEFVGWLSGHNRALAEQLRDDAAVGGVLTFTGFVPRAEALAKLARANAALHLLADGPGKELFVAAKLYDYLALDLPVLAAVPRGDVRAILGDLDWGIVVDPTESGVADGLERLVDAPQASRRADPSGLYDRVNLARRLGAILDDVVQEP